ncbi:hypothetical protein V1527DRAFT_458621 [Lipomyces starkeyi]
MNHELKAVWRLSSTLVISVISSIFIERGQACAKHSPNISGASKLWSGHALHYSSNCSAPASKYSVRRISLSHIIPSHTLFALTVHSHPSSLSTSESLDQNQPATVKSVTLLDL